MQTTIQILRCLTLGRYTAGVVEGELRIRGPQPLAGPLPASIKAQRDELVDFLNEYCGGTWPAAAGSDVRILRAHQERRAARRKARHLARLAWRPAA
jgi:hypothetical protein